MRIEFEHTPEDWRAYLHLITERSRSLQTRFWILPLVAMGIAVLMVLGAPRLGWHLDAYSLLAGVLLVYLVLAIAVRINRRPTNAPESWFGPHVYDFRDDGIHRETTLGTAVVRWRAVREVRETPAHLFLLLDSISALVIPKRALEPHGGASAVIAEIERLRTGARSAESETPAVAAPTAAPATDVPPTRMLAPSPGWTALPHNLLAGLRLVTFLPVRGDDFRPSVRQVALLIALALIPWAAVQRVFLEGPVEFNWWSVGQVAWLTGVALFVLALLTSRGLPSATATRLFTAIASAAPWLVSVGLLVNQATMNAGPSFLWALALGAYVGVVIYRAQRAAVGELRAPAIARAGVTIVLTWLVFGTTVYALPEFWFATDAYDEEGESGWYDQAESLLFAQPELVDAAVERVAAGTPGRTETYFVGFAGFGEQGVFDREARFAGEAFGRRLDLSAHSLVLINKANPDEDTPLATLSGLRRALAGVAERMNKDEDVLLLFLTSHGSEGAELSVRQGSLPLDQVDGTSLRAALDDAGIEWRIIVISACYSGGFIPYLSEEHTLIVTAASADRTSFGCSDERDLTYFGEALLRDALPVSTDLIDAARRAQRLIEERERSEHLEPSHPQLFVGEAMRSKLAELAFLPNGVAGTARTAANHRRASGRS